MKFFLRRTLIQVPVACFIRHSLADRASQESPDRQARRGTEAMMALRECQEMRVRPAQRETPAKLVHQGPLVPLE